MSRNFTLATDKLSTANFALPQSKGTVALWVKVTRHDLTQIPFSIWQDASNYFQIALAGGQVWAGWMTSAFFYSINPSPPNDGQWNQLIVCWTTSSVTYKVRCYTIDEVGNIYYGNRADNATWDTSSYSLYFGWRADDAGSPFYGQLGPCAVWNIGIDDPNDDNGLIGTNSGWICALRDHMPLTRIAPPNLIHFWQMSGDRDPEPDWGITPTASLTVSGAAKGPEDPPIGIYRFAGRGTGPLHKWTIPGKSDFMPTLMRFMG